MFQLNFMFWTFKTCLLLLNFMWLPVYSFLPMTFFPKQGFGRGGFNEAPQVIKSYSSHLKKKLMFQEIHTWSTERRLKLQVLMAHHETSRSAIITVDRKEAWTSGPHGSPWDLSICNHHGRPKEDLNFRSSWLTMRPLDPRSLWPTEKRLQLQVLMANHETFRSTIFMADRKEAWTSGPHGSPWDLSIRDLNGRLKGGLNFRSSEENMLLTQHSAPHGRLWGDSRKVINQLLS